MVYLTISTKHLNLLLSLKVYVQYSLVQLLVLPIHLLISKNTGQKQVVTEDLSLLHVSVNIGYRVLESLGEQLTVLLAKNLVPCSASRKNLLLSNDLDLINNLLTLTFQYAFKHLDAVVYQI